MKDVVGYEQYFQITKDGKLWSKRTNKFLKQTIGKTGYYTVATKIGGRKGINKCFKIHRLVAQAYIPNPKNKPFVNHIDGNKLNNHVSNLEWVTNQENVIHAINLGLITFDHITGSKGTKAKLTDEDVLKIREDFLTHTYKNKTEFCKKYSKLYNIGRSTIFDILNRKTYKNI